ncbi:heterokaryon incompatibility protein-domain-containing protein [Xylariales sp. PMI_506]|nr:heterokaryon incompatibility protein-domain-containing protein [Xylariales sp. PMI_506]
MRLLQLDTKGNFCFTKDLVDDIPPYAILSHTWGADEDEVAFADIGSNTARGKVGFRKLEFCVKRARADGIQYFWVDTCCINKANFTELSTAINSMFRWYQQAQKCYVYLADVHKESPTAVDRPAQPGWEIRFRKSRWFTRGWTLQELVAPTTVEFFSSEGEHLGDKMSLERLLCSITGISTQVLQGTSLSNLDAAERIAWIAKRQTKLPEDMAYCLLGIFDVHIPLIYGEGMDNAFRRLRVLHSRRSIRVVRWNYHFS